MAAKGQKTRDATAGSDRDAVIFFLLLAFRTINALAVRTFFQPDEYFQSLEPAWETAFGPESGAWITWEWREGLRSSLHPLLFAGVYKAAAKLGDFWGLSTFAHADSLIAAPKLLQAIFAAAMDFATYRLATRVYGEKSRNAYAALFLTVLSPWQAFCSVRTLSNSIETTLTVVALNLWPWDWFVADSAVTKGSGPTGQQGSRSPPGMDSSPPFSLYSSLAAAALACVLRPTNIIVWATVSSTLLIRFGSFGKIVTLAEAAFLSGGAILVLSASADKAFYGDWVLPPLRFLQFNLVQSLAVFYGRNRPDYYFTEGLPLLLITAIPFAIIGLWTSLRREAEKIEPAEQRARMIRPTLATAIVSTVGLLSLISHKEVRFIYPLLPMLHVLAAKPLAVFFSPFPAPSGNIKRALLLLMICINITIAWYTVFVHQRGVIDVMNYLRQKHDGIPHLDDASTTIGFLMPCHSTPWRSHLVHSDTRAWALTCEPPINLTMSERQSYRDEADVFYDDPAAWIHANMRWDHPGLKPAPDYLVLFEQLEPQLEVIFQDEALDRYVPDRQFFNTHWHDDWRRQGDIVVWRRENEIVCYDD